MHCFYHQDIEAVGTCKNCGRGLCPVCAIDVGNGLACPQRCEDEVRSLNRIIARNKTAYQKTSGAYARVALFYSVVGLGFLAAGVVNWHGFAWMLIPAGLIFLVAGLVHYTTGRRFERE